MLMLWAAIRTFSPCYNNSLVPLGQVFQRIFDFSLWISLWINLGITEDNSTFVVDKWRINESYVMLHGDTKHKWKRYISTYPQGTFPTYSLISGKRFATLLKHTNFGSPKTHKVIGEREILSPKWGTSTVNRTFVL